MADFSSFTDEQLAILAPENDEALYCLLKRYESRILSYIIKRAGSGIEQAEDILQETFLSVYRNLNGFDAKLKFSSWIYRIAHNEAVNYYRKHRRHANNVSLDYDDNGNGFHEILHDTLDIQASYISGETRAAIHSAFMELPDKYRDVMTLRYLEEMNYRDISDILRIPEGTVATLINRAKKKLKTIISHSFSWLTEEG